MNPNVIVWLLMVSKALGVPGIDGGFPVVAFDSKAACVKALEKYEHGTCISFSVTMDPDWVGDKEHGAFVK